MQLCYDEVTRQYFVGEPISIKAKLKILELKKEFQINEYCDALGIARTDPFNDCWIEVKDDEIYKDLIFIQTVVLHPWAFSYTINECAIRLSYM